LRKRRSRLIFNERRKLVDKEEGGEIIGFHNLILILALKFLFDEFLAPAGELPGSSRLIISRIRRGGLKKIENSSLAEVPKQPSLLLCLVLSLICPPLVLKGQSLPRSFEFLPSPAESKTL
jgi:hypothetical protein